MIKKLYCGALWYCICVGLIVSCIIFYLFACLIGRKDMYNDDGEEI
jgi:phosphotransferase system  glucose/maltose/N-acetylglucosamine-specific IIC component